MPIVFRFGNATVSQPAKQRGAGLPATFYGLSRLPLRARARECAGLLHTKTNALQQDCPIHKKLLALPHGSPHEAYAGAHGEPPVAPRTKSEFSRSVRVWGSARIASRLPRVRPLPRAGNCRLGRKSRRQSGKESQEVRSGAEVIFLFEFRCLFF